MIKNNGFIAPWISLAIFIVIPIVSIGWMVMQTYAQDAKNTTIRQSMWRVFEAYSTAGIRGESLSLLIDTHMTDRSIHVNSGHTILGIQSPSKIVTRAGDVHFTHFAELEKDEMYDIRGKWDAGSLPLIWYAASSQQSVLQVASTLMGPDDTYRIYVIGNFVADFGDWAASWLIGNESGTGELINNTLWVHR